MKPLVRTLLITLILVTSTQVFTNILPYYNLLDEVLLLLLILISFLHIDIIKVSKNKAIVFIVFSVVLILSSVYNFYRLPPLIIKSLYYFKTLISFGIIGFLSNKYLRTKDISTVYKIIFYLSLFSLIEFVFVQFYYFNSGVKYELWGLTLKVRNNIYRAASLTGHPISLGMMALIAFVFSVETRKKIISINSLIFIAAIIVSGSRVPLVLSIIYLPLKTLNYKFFKIKELKMKYLYGLIIPFFIAIIYFNIGNYLKERNEVAASRGMAISKGSELLLNPSIALFGTGIGSFGTFESVEFKSPIYDLINYPNHYREILVTTNRGTGIESFLFMILIEMGIVGTTLYFLLIIPIKSSYSYIEFFLVISLIIYSAAYPIYTLPYIFLLALLFPCFSLHKNVKII